MLSKTPKASAKKIKWARKQGLHVLGLLLLSAIFLVVFILLLALKDYDKHSGGGCRDLEIGQQCFITERADTDGKRLKGLSGRDSLPQNTAMIFEFEQVAKQCMWMKDMKFPIDIIWLDKQQRVVKIEHVVTASTYPTNFCADGTKYVIEINSGLAQSLDLKEGDTIHL